jgi:hypothetical protein
MQSKVDYSFVKLGALGVRPRFVLKVNVLLHWGSADRLGQLFMEV